MSNPTRYIICFEYFGRFFFGSQKQPDKRTVQEEIEKALCTLIKQNISIFLSGRTDAKVSAKFQVAHFDINGEIEKTESFLYHLNCILPHDIKVFEIRKAEPTFHAQKSAKYKHYRYTILNSHVASAFCDSYLFFPYMRLDLNRINKSLSYLIGHHDFGAFKSKSDNPYDDCKIYFANAQEIRQERNEFVFIDIVGNRFLYNMVRTIVGTVLWIERNNLSPEIMKEILDSKDRQKSANVVEAKALTLEYVGYDNVDSYIQRIIQKEGK